MSFRYNGEIYNLKIAENIGVWKTNPTGVTLVKSKTADCPNRIIEVKGGTNEDVSIDLKELDGTMVFLRVKFYFPNDPNYHPHELFSEPQ